MNNLGVRKKWKYSAEGKILRIRKNEINGWHSCYGDWTLHEVSKELVRIRLNSIQHLLTDDRLQLLNHKDISWKGKNYPLSVTGKHCICCAGRRYHNCDINVPCIVLENASNPDNLKYRMIDGKHRMMKMRAHGQLDSMFYVLSLNSILPFITY